MKTPQEILAACLTQLTRDDRGRLIEAIAIIDGEVEGAIDTPEFVPKLAPHGVQCTTSPIEELEAKTYRDRLQLRNQLIGMIGREPREEIADVILRFYNLPAAGIGDILKERGYYSRGTWWRDIKPLRWIHEERALKEAKQ